MSFSGCPSAKEPAGDVGMVQRGQDPGLALKPRDPLRVGGERRGQDLDGDVAIEPRVPRPIHFAHPAGPEGGNDLVRAEAGTGSEGQTLAVDYTGGTAARTGLLLSDAVFRNSVLENPQALPWQN